MKRLLFILVVFIGSVCLAAAANVTRCCEPGFYMKQDRENQVVVCRNNITNVTTQSFLTTNLKCEQSALFTESDAFFNVSDDGAVVVWNEWNEPEIKDGACIGETNSKSMRRKFFTRRAAAVCIYDFEASEAKAYCILASVVFLYVTAAIYGLPELRDLQGKVLISLCLSLATGLLIIAIQLLTITELNSGHCLTRALLGYFFLIAAFLWMSAISIQILLSISCPTTGKFRWYALVAWGLAVAMTVLVGVLDKVEGPHIKPGIGRNSCWLYGTKQVWAYLYSVMAVTMGTNLLIFIYVSVILWRSTFTSDHIRAIRYKFKKMCYLFVIMGIPWIFEMISGSFQQHIITVILDFFNALVGVLFFLVLVVMRPRARKALLKHKVFCCLSEYIERRNANEDDPEANAIMHTAITLQ